MCCTDADAPCPSWGPRLCRELSNCCSPMTAADCIQPWIYLSDNGESLGENNIYLLDLPYVFAPDVQKHVPMLLWVSPKMQADFQIDTPVWNAEGTSPSAMTTSFIPCLVCSMSRPKCTRTISISSPLVALVGSQVRRSDWLTRPPSKGARCLAAERRPRRDRPRWPRDSSSDTPMSAHHAVNALEICPLANGNITWFGGEDVMVRSAQWRAPARRYPSVS